MAKFEVSWLVQLHSSYQTESFKGYFKVLNKEVFGKVEVKKKEALRRVSFWDDLEKQRERLKKSSRVGLFWKRFPGDKNPGSVG